MTARKNEVAVNRTFFGRHLVSYSCPYCRENLRSNLRSAGQLETCPSCGGQIRVPGASRKELLEDELDLPRPRQVEATKLKNEAELEILSAQLKQKIESTKAEQRLLTIRSEKELESQYFEQFLSMTTEEKDAKLGILIELGNLLSSRIIEVQKQPWSEEVKTQAIRELKEVQQAAQGEIMGD